MPHAYEFPELGGHPDFGTEINEALPVTEKTIADIKTALDQLAPASYVGVKGDTYYRLTSYEEGQLSTNMVGSIEVGDLANINKIGAECTQYYIIKKATLII